MGSRQPFALSLVHVSSFWFLRVANKMWMPPGLILCLACACWHEKIKCKIVKKSSSKTFIYIELYIICYYLVALIVM